jgi:hypothetical protein
VLATSLPDSNSQIWVQIESLSNQIVKDEIELHRLVIEFSGKNRVENIAKKRRQYLWDGGNSAATEAGLLDAVHVFFAHAKYRTGLVAFQKPSMPPVFLLGRVSKEVPGSQNAGQFYPQIIGQEFNAGGNLYELCSNVGFRLHRRHQSITPSQAIIKARDLLGKIDQNILERQALLNSAGVFSIDYIHTSEYASETEALHIVRNSLLNEFSAAYVLRLREFFAMNTVEVVDLIRNTVGAIGNQMSVRAGYTGNHHLNGLGNVLEVISAMTITIKPFFLRKVMDLEEKRARKELSKTLGDVDSFSGDLRRLQGYQNNHFENAAFARRHNAIDREIQILSMSRLEEDASLSRQERRLRTETGRDVFTGPTKAVSSTLSVIGQYDSHTIKNATQRSQLAAAGNTTYSVGQAYNFEVLTRAYLTDEARYQRRKRLHETPAEQMHKQDEELIQLKRSVEGTAGQE